jgi:hypothetical protein
MSLNDVEHLPDDLAGLQEQVNAQFTSLVMLIGQMNAIRKVL